MENPGTLNTSPTVGVSVTLERGLRSILAPNASPMTYWGTNTYLIGVDELAVIDPGPDDVAHLDAILMAVGTSRITHIVVTHSHLDHSPLARALSEETGAPVLAFGDSDAGKSAVMKRMPALGGGEGVDRDFVPDVVLPDGACLTSDEWELRVLHTPGHMGNHISLCWDDVIFTGDLVMGWASTMVSPPDGDLSDFLSSCERLKGLAPRRLFPAHGNPIDDPVERIDWLIEHRLERTREILAALEKGPSDIATLTKTIYTDAPAGLLAAAARNVLAHLIDLHESGKIAADPALHPEAQFAISL